MQNDWLEMLESPLRPVRMEGWNVVRRRITPDPTAFSLKERKKLIEFFRNEIDPDVKQNGSETLIELAVICPVPTAERPAIRKKKPEYLADWLWGAFKNKSAVLNVSDPRQMRRDESALFTIGRILALSDYPNVQPHSIELDSPDWRPIRLLEPESLCIVGRLGLYGPQALQWWRSESARFTLVTHQRPEHLRPGELDPDYHYVSERLPDGQTRRYQTRDEDGRRTDYCVVQRYVVTDGTRQIVIVNCAGPTSLGTLGAVTWSANELARPGRPDGRPIPLPKTLHFASRLDAILEVTAELTGVIWSPNPAKLISLRVDDWVWQEDPGEWRVESPGQIRVVLQDGDPDQPVRILLDGKESTMDQSGQAYRLLARLLWKWHNRTENRVTVQDLASDPWIWGGHSLDEHRAHNRLKEVKQRYLRDALVITADSISLRAEVVIEKQTNAEGFLSRLPPVLAPVSTTPSQKESAAPSNRVRPRKRPR